MKTARFSQLVSSAGKPKVHLLLMDPKADREFQSALKADRVLTIHHQNVGTKKDVGVVGYESDGPVQVLVFPKSIKQFSGAKIVGINYDVLKEDLRKPEPRTRAPARNRISRAPRRSSKPKAKRAAAPPEPKREIEKSVEKPQEEPQRHEASREELVAGIRRALKALDAGRQVAAYRMLEQLIQAAGA